MLSKEKSKLGKYFTTAQLSLIVLLFISSIFIVSAQEKKDVDVPFAIIENSPVYPGCNENGSKKEIKDCLSQKISEFVAQNFNTKLAKEESLKGLQKIWVAFKIDKEGNILEVKARAPHESLAVEARRVMSLLPQMKSGKHKGKLVTVPYSLPIQFMVK
ncbi:hypothetical protein [Pseudofulvibacter geojedonensis]|uniref:TonB C-terminal domain-containing protein n=1 Tax=Pseudofulvibacter geojedonensis TaxID=1123758 RepID=A0ABW3I3I1_9FLAO